VVKTLLSLSAKSRLHPLLHNATRAVFRLLCGGEACKHTTSCTPSSHVKLASNCLHLIHKFMECLHEAGSCPNESVNL